MLNIQDVEQGGRLQDFWAMWYCGREGDRGSEWRRASYIGGEHVGGRLSTHRGRRGVSGLVNTSAALALLRHQHTSSEAVAESLKCDALAEWCHSACVASAVQYSPSLPHHHRLLQSSPHDSGEVCTVLVSTEEAPSECLGLTQPQPAQMGRNSGKTQSTLTSATIR